MKIGGLFKQKTVFSFEIFPPKSEAGIDTIYGALEEIGTSAPDFISVTYGAGGVYTAQIAETVEKRYGIPSVAHLTCMYSGRDDVLRLTKDLKAKGIDNVLALRGDAVAGAEAKGEFKYASDVIEFIKSVGDFHIIGACYPEGHAEAKDTVEDVRNLKRKVDAGAEHLISQLFFDNDSFYAFLERARLVGIDVPVQAGIMPVTNKKQIERMVALCGVRLPKKFLKIMERYEHRPEAMRDAGIAYAIDQIVDLTARGVDGIHLYTMNQPYVARKIKDAVSNIITN
ncbi:MAG: methylenetetrahydrofolate reductase [NAD(P)H] [Clostridiales bacterium]|jgi:methylenetetrahydrofolate reductase (NADPH)|nr:methylenetetrahydrofolate reductase [NAD(P)H] [Clostridiales bacterium]